MFGYTWRLEVDTGNLLQSVTILVLEAVPSLNVELIKWLDWLASGSLASSSLYPYLPALGLQANTAMHGILSGGWDLNSGPLASYIASAFTTKPPPQDASYKKAILETMWQLLKKLRGRIAMNFRSEE